MVKFNKFLASAAAIAVGAAGIVAANAATGGGNAYPDNFSYKGLGSDQKIYANVLYPLGFDYERNNSTGFPVSFNANYPDGFKTKTNLDEGFGRTHDYSKQKRFLANDDPFTAGSIRDPHLKFINTAKPKPEVDYSYHFHGNVAGYFEKPGTYDVGGKKIEVLPSKQTHRPAVATTIKGDDVKKYGTMISKNLIPINGVDLTVITADNKPFKSISANLVDPNGKVVPGSNVIGEKFMKKSETGNKVTIQVPKGEASKLWPDGGAKIAFTGAFEPTKGSTNTTNYNGVEDTYYDVYDNVILDIVLKRFEEGRRAIIVSPEEPEIIASTKCGVEDTVFIPESSGVEYKQTRQGDRVVVVAIAKDGYKIDDKAIKEWELTIDKEDCETPPTPPTPVTPAPPKVIPAVKCETDDTLEITETEGVEYVTTTEGEHTIVTAKPKTGYVIAEGAQTKWILELKGKLECEHEPTPPAPKKPEPPKPTPPAPKKPEPPKPAPPAEKPQSKTPKPDAPQSKKVTPPEKLAKTGADGVGVLAVSAATILLGAGAVVARKRFM